MSNPIRVNFTTRRRIAELPPVDPTYFGGDDFELEAKAGAVQLVFRKPINTWSVRKIEAFIAKLEQIAMSAELLAEDGQGG